MKLGDIILKNSFLTRLLTIVIFLTAALLFWSGSLMLHSYETIREVGVRNLKLSRISGTIIYLDEVLTMSARMYAATGDSKWVVRYQEFEPELEAAIQAAKNLIPEVYANQMAGKTEQANMKLVEMEKESFEEVRRGQWEEAKKILFSDAYEGQKKIYADGIYQMDWQIRQHIEDIIYKEKHVFFKTISEIFSQSHRCKAC